MADRHLSQRGGATHVDLPGDVLKPGQLLRLSRLGRELRLTDQILSMDLDTVSIVADGPAPAWTSLEGDHVHFSMRQMPFPTTRIDVAVWLGTNAHELGHVLFSPRKGSMLMHRVIEGDRMHLRGLAQLCNIVEDQRQERLVLSRFAPWQSYLTAALGHHLVADSDTAWLLMAGRTWLPDSVRAEAKAKFIVAWGRQMADEVTSIVGEYQRLTDPGDLDVDEAWELLMRLHNLFDGAMPTLPKPCVQIEGGEPDTSEPGEDAPDTADEAEAEGGGGEGEAGDGDGENTGDAADGDGDDEGDGGQSTGSGAGQSPAHPSQNDRARIRKELKKAASDQLDADDTAAEDLDSILDALRYGRAGDDVDGGDPSGRFEVATDAARRLHREVGDALLDLKDESEPGWLKRTDSGRLNVRRLTDPYVDPDQLFDRYEPGMMDASELEVVLLIDVSGSMNSQLFKLAETTWAIRHAVDDLEGEATVLTWDSGPHRVLAAPGVRPDDRMFVPNAMGGTDPKSALGEAFRVMSDSQARNRLVVILTDGDWWNAGRSHELIEALNASGVITVMALLGHDSGDSLHGCQHGGRIDDPSELARMFQRVAAARIGEWR